MKKIIAALSAALLLIHTSVSAELIVTGMDENFIYAENDATNDETVTLIRAGFNENKLQAVGFGENIEIPSRSAVRIALQGNKNDKLFIWDSITGMKPIQYAKSKKTLLVFEIDENIGGYGLLSENKANLDRLDVYLSNIAAALAPLMEQYRVSVLIYPTSHYTRGAANPIDRLHPVLAHTINFLGERGIGTILELVSSGVGKWENGVLTSMTMAPMFDTADDLGRKGLSMDLDALGALSDSCGGNVWGVRLHEVYGGLGTTGRVPMFCQFSDGYNFLAGGIGKEIHSLCLSNDAVSPDDYSDHSYKRESISIKSEKLKRIYDDIVLGASVDLLFQTKLIDAVVQNGNIDYVVCMGKSAMFAIQARVYIDCTGDADLSFHAGAVCEKGNEEGYMQPGTLCSLWSDIDWDRVKKEGFHDLWPNNFRQIAKAYEDGVFDILDKGLPGMWRVGKTTGGGNIGHSFMVDGTDERSLTTAFIESRRLLKKYEVYYKNYLKGFEDMELLDTGAMFGIRETRRVMGDYILTADDYFKRAVFEDEIGRYNYALDSHPPKCDEESHKEFSRLFAQGYKDGESYGIPYRTLTPKGIDNLLVAGRCISTDRNMQASVRVMPGCFITGQAAGIAAGISIEEGEIPRKIDIKKLQQALKSAGAYLPNS